MNKGSISIYYNLEWGYIVVSDTILQDSVMRVTIPPVMTEKNNATEVCLGKKVLDALEKSRNAIPVTEEEIADFNFWQVSGIKGYSTFSKRFQCIEVEERDAVYHVEKLVRARNGSYVWDEDVGGIDLDLDCNEERIGRVIYNLFHEGEVVEEQDDVVSFESVNDSKVSFNRPKEQFIDIGDGNTDAYQIYAYVDDEKTNIAFLIDNGYVQVDQQGILNRWKQIYGDVQEFCFKEKAQGTMRYVVTARTQEVSIKSYLYKDGDGWLEVLMEVGNRLTAKQRTQVIDCMDDMIQTIVVQS